MKILAQGAEAIVMRKDNSVVKRRYSKAYRYPLLDEKLRKMRTRSEVKILEKVKSIIPVPKLIAVDEKKTEIVLEYLAGKKLAGSLEKQKNKKEIAKQIGDSIAKIHNQGLIHGDLTTSNMILVNKKVFFIDFGLGYHSAKTEDRAVDLHVLKEALEAKHSKDSKLFWKSIINAYKKEVSDKKVITRLEKVEKRGRYKEQY